ncbi:hypothetical protein CK203_063192 [Vitis vinifera]|uniref:Uncharacterized protein n=1 Tax=Vitis vinifera TaxID=29760 RepID=A0A438FQB1_VITVI|nr:hypothetical protein CK203_063192 [Vitis vinifera]
MHFQVLEQVDQKFLLGLACSQFHTLDNHFSLLPPETSFLYVCIAYMHPALVLRGHIEGTEREGKRATGTEPEPEPTTEVLFLCSYEGCGKTFIDAGALRKPFTYPWRETICLPL